MTTIPWAAHDEVKSCIGSLHQRAATVSYPYHIVELFIALHLFFVAAHSLRVVTAEISVAVLHPLAYFTRELRRKHSDEVCQFQLQNLSLVSCLSPAHLCDQNVRHCVDGVISVAGREQTFSLTLF